MSPLLIAMAGLPGVGKSALAEAVASRLPATILSVDPVEAAMWRSGIDPEQPTGLAAYVVADTLAREQLRLGMSVVVDAANYVEPGRQMWRELAAECGVPLRWLEVTCTDIPAHRARLEARDRGFGGRLEPTWADIERRMTETDPWPASGDERLILDAVEPAAALTERALAWLSRAD